MPSNVVEKARRRSWKRGRQQKGRRKGCLRDGPEKRGQREEQFRVRPHDYLPYSRAAYNLTKAFYKRKRGQSMLEHEEKRGARRLRSAWNKVSPTPTNFKLAALTRQRSDIATSSPSPRCLVSRQRDPSRSSHRDPSKHDDASPSASKAPRGVSIPPRLVRNATVLLHQMSSS